MAGKNKLTIREVLFMIIRGNKMSSGDLARLLGMNKKTVQTHLQALRDRGHIKSVRDTSGRRIVYYWTALKSDIPRDMRGRNPASLRNLAGERVTVARAGVSLRPSACEVTSNGNPPRIPSLADLLSF